MRAIYITHGQTIFQARDILPDPEDYVISAHLTTQLESCEPSRRTEARTSALIPLGTVAYAITMGVPTVLDTRTLHRHANVVPCLASLVLPTSSLLCRDVIMIAQ